MSLSTDLKDDYQRAKEMERLNWTHRAQSEARLAVAAIVRSLGGKVVVPRVDQIAADGEGLFVSRDARTGDLTYELRPTVSELGSRDA